MIRRAIAEGLGTAGLLVVVVGSGIMGQNLAGGNDAIALLANSLATGAGLYALIRVFGPISGAHFNPVVSLSEMIWRKITPKDFGAYVVCQIIGGILGVMLSHYMFGLDLLQLSTHDRSDLRFFVSEIVATAGLILVIALSGRKNVEATPIAVALYITSAYWCTSSTSFANPAVTIARALTDTFAGIQWRGAPSFIVAQVIGSIVGIIISRYLVKTTFSDKFSKA